MKNKVPVIGLSHHMGIFMFGGGMLCSARKGKNGNIKLSSRKWINLKPKGFIVLIAVLLLLSFWYDSANVENISVLQTMTELLLMMTILFLGIWLSRKTPLKKIYQHHSAEHMVLSAYSKGLPNTVENVKSESRVSLSCGGMLVIPFLLMAIIFTAVEVIIESEILRVLMFVPLMLFITTYKFSMIPIVKVRVRRPKIYLWLDKAGVYLQKGLTTLPPEDADIDLSIACLEQLLASIHECSEQP